MNAAQALEAVSRIYVPGVAKYYNALTPDPWFQALEQLEQTLEDMPFDLHDGPCRRYVARCEELIERFKRESQPSKGVSFADGMNMGDKAELDREATSRIRSWQSRKGKYCLKCEGTTDLTLVAREDDKTQVDIVCRSCVAAQPKVRHA